MFPKRLSTAVDPILPWIGSLRLKHVLIRKLPARRYRFNIHNSDDF